MGNYNLEAAIMGLDQGDWEQYARHHVDLYGHAPRPNISTRELCTHPLHIDIQRAIQAPGVEIAMRHEQVHPDTLVTADDHEIDPRFNLDEWAKKEWKGERMIKGEDGRES
jgi:hypothetical protein